MRFPPSFIEEIKARLPVSAVVGRRVALKKAGREWRGLSPFNAEKTPSFYVNDQKQAWFDFSSGKNGNIFTFLMETEGLSFPEAVERLAQEAGLPVPQMTREAEEREKQRSTLHDVMELAATFFEDQLKAAAGGKARRYLDGRELDLPIRAAFRLGYAPPDRFALRDHLAGKGIERDAMIEAGLLVHGEDIPVPYDRFRDRIMFPIADARGRIIAFGGRAMEADVPAKYLNSPDTPLFHKGHVVYNHHHARKAAHDRGTVIAVEGYVDVIAMTRAGFPNTVAPLGTALTEDQLGLLWRMADEPILCFDGDKAGRRAAYRAIDVAMPLLQAGKSLRFALLPEGQDPDDLYREAGSAAIESVLQSARPLADLLWTRETEAAPMDTPERKAAFERRLRETLNAVKDETIRRHYRQEMDRRLANLFNAGQTVYQRGSFRDRNNPRFAGRGVFSAGPMGRPVQNAPLRASMALAGHAMFSAKPAVSAREALILTVLARHPALLEQQVDDIADLHFNGREAEKLRRGLVDAIASGADVAAVPALLARIGLGAQIGRLESLVRPGDRWVLAADADEFSVADSLRQALALHRRAITLHTELQAAERELSRDGNEAALERIREITTELAALDGAEADLEAVSTGLPIKKG